MTNKLKTRIKNLELEVDSLHTAVVLLLQLIVERLGEEEDNANDGADWIPPFIHKRPWWKVWG